MPRSERSRRAAARHDDGAGDDRILLVRSLQLVLVVAFLAGWQFLPQIESLSDRFRFVDPIYVSSPTKVWDELYYQFVGNDSGGGEMWSFMWPTVWASIIGLGTGIVAGLVVGLVLAESRLANRVLRPFLIAMNAVPRIALVPVFIIAFGPSLRGTAAVSFAVVFFVAFFNAYEGGSSVQTEVLQNARLLGASRLQVLGRVRLPYAVAWTFASLPLSVTFAVISVVTAEVLIGARGLGRMLLISMQTGAASLTFAVTIILSLLGLAGVALAEVTRARLLHWWRP